MSEVDQLKTEARQLFEEANNNLANPRLDNEWQFYNSKPALENSFKHRLKELRKRAVSLKLINASFVHGSR